MAATPEIIDFTDVKDDNESGFRPRHVPPGDYRARVVKVDDFVSKAGNKQWLFAISLDGVARATYPYYVPRDVKSAWKVRNLFIAAGMQVPKKKLKVDPNKLVGKTIGVAMDDEEYNDKMKSIIAATFPASDVGDSPVSSDSSSEDVGDSEEVDDMEIEDI